MIGFHGCVKNDAYLSTTGLGKARGATKPGEGNFSHFFKVSELAEITNTESLAEYVLDARLGLDSDALVKPGAKFTLTANGKIMMVDFSQELIFKVPKDEEGPTVVGVSITFYLPNEKMAKARAKFGGAKWEAFKEQAASVAFGKKVSNNDWALMLGKSPGTIKAALDVHNPTSNGNTIGDLEKFMGKYESESYISLPGLLAYKQGLKAKKGGKKVVPPTNFQDITATVTPTGPRARTFITTLYGQFIDEYVETFRALSGQASARDNLIKEIMKNAKTRSALASDDVPSSAVKKRLGNTLAKANKAAKKEAVEEEDD